MKKIVILFLTLFLCFFFIEKNTPIKAEGVPMLDKMGEISKIQIVDSVGRFEKIGNTKYKYTYVKISYNEEFGYYYHPNATTESVDISLSEMPKLAFDSNDNLINGYFSINNNYWYKCEVMDRTKKTEFHWTYEKNFVPHPFVDNERLCYFEIYFNFNFNFDVIFELSYNLPLYYYKKLGKDLFVSNFECNLKCDQYVRDMSVSIWDEILPLIGIIKSFSKKEKSVIEAGNYVVNSKNYNCKTTFVDNKYFLFDAHVGLFNSNEIVLWESSNTNSPTLFNPKYFPSSNDKNPNVEDKTMFADCVYSYKGVIFKIDNMEGIQDYDKDHPMADSRNWLQKLLDKLFPNKGESINIVLICVIILFIILLVVCVVSKIRQNKLLKYQIKNEKTNSYRGGFKSNDK